MSDAPDPEAEAIYTNALCQFLEDGNYDSIEDAAEKLGVTTQDIHDLVFRPLAQRLH